MLRSLLRIFSAFILIALIILLMFGYMTLPLLIGIVALSTVDNNMLLSAIIAIASIIGQIAWFIEMNKEW